MSVALAAVLVISLSAPVWGSETEAVAPTRFLMMSDIHFDPMADPKLVDRPSSTESEEWRAIFESSDNKSPARYGADSNWALRHSALGQAKQALPNPDFIVLPGDLLPHNFRYRFDVSAADHSDAAYRLFVRKMMLLLVLHVEQSFPDTPILPALRGQWQIRPGVGRAQRSTLSNRHHRRDIVDAGDRRTGAQVHRPGSMLQMSQMKTARLLGAEEAVAGVAKPGQDVAVPVEAAV
jgi:hypothetical protein